MSSETDIARNTLRRLLTHDMAPGEAVSAVVCAVQQLIGAQLAAVLQFEAHETFHISALPAERQALFRQPALTAYLRQAAASGTTVLWRNNVPAELAQLPELSHPATALIVPFPIDRNRNGVMCAFDIDSADTHTPAIQAVEMLTRTLGLVLRNAALEREATQLHAQLEQLTAEHKHEEQQLHVAMLALETTSESVHWLDGDGNIIYANPATARELGYSAEEIRRLCVSDIDPHVSLEQFRAGSDLGQRMHDGIRKFRTEHLRKDGSMIPVEIDADAFEYEGKRYIVAIGRDISERVAAEKALRESEAKFSAMFSLTPDPLVLTRFSDGVMLEANHSFCAVFGYEAGEVVGQTTLPDGINLWTDGELREQWQEQLERSGELTGYETPLRRKDGSIITVLMSAKVIEMGGERCVIVDAHDITRRKEIEQALRREKAEQGELIRKLEEAQSQLLQSEKLASIGQLAAGIAHEINNPIGYVGSNLSTLQGYIEDLLELVTVYESGEPLLQREPQLFERITQIKDKSDIAFLRDDIRSLIAESMDGANRVRRIVQDLRDFSRVGATEWQRYDIHSGLDSTINVVWNEIKYKAELVREYGTVPEVDCIPSQLNQVFMNLLVNAAQAIAERGTITIHTDCVAGMARVAVSDTGQGILPENLAKLFDPFFTTKPVGQGTGLGLSVSYGIIKHHGGHIDVRSEPGKGTTFTVCLPLDHPPTDDEENPTPG